MMSKECSTKYLIKLLKIPPKYHVFSQWIVCCRWAILFYLFYYIFEIAHSASFKCSAWMLFLLHFEDLTCISQTISKSLYVNNLELVLVTAWPYTVFPGFFWNRFLVLNKMIFFIEAEKQQKDQKETRWFWS